MKIDVSVQKKVIIALVAALVLSAGLCLSFCSGGFSSEPVIKAAKENGMRNISLAQYEKREQGGMFGVTEIDEEGNLIAAYHVAKDSDEANYIYSNYQSLETVGNVSLKGAVYCEDPSVELSVGLMIAADKNSANRLYDGWAEYLKEENPVITTGKKAGYKYTIGYFTPESGGRKYYIGIYKKGNTVVILGGDGDTKEGRQKLETFCKELGVISPLTDQ